MKTISRRLALLYGMASLVSSARAGDHFPEFLVGVWTPDDAEFQGEQLIKGSAIYLSPSGRGAIIGGPPPIGFRIESEFDPATNRLDLQAFDGNRKGPLITAKYDPLLQLLVREEAPLNPLKRRAKTLPQALLKKLGL